MEARWNEHYREGTLPWDTGAPSQALVQLVEDDALPTGRALEIGCGTGTNALWLAAEGYKVLAIDGAPLAIEQARAKLSETPALRCRFEVADFLADPIEGGYDLVFDRGCFHTFDDPQVRADFARRVASLLNPGGVWLSLIGSTEGPPRDHGPPRRSAADIVAAIEPVLAITSIQAGHFSTVDGEDAPTAWVVMATPRGPSPTGRAE